VVHDARCFSAAQEGAGQVDADHLLPRLERHVDELVRLLEPGVVHQQVEPTQCVRRLAEAALDVRLTRDVHLDRGSAAATRLDCLGHRARGRCIPHVVDRDRRAVSGQLERGCLSDARVGPRHKRAAAV